MVVGNNDIDAETVCMSHFFHISDSAINGDKESCAIFCKFIYRIGIESISFVMPVWNVVLKVFIFYFFKKIMENNASGNAVTVIVSIHDYFFFVVDGAKNAFDRLLHIKNQKRIVDIALVVWVEKFFRFSACSNPAVFKKCLRKGMVCRKFIIDHRCFL